VCMYVYMYVCIERVCVCGWETVSMRRAIGGVSYVCLFVCVCVFVCIYIYIYIHTHTYRER
jgi:hypothetical protein